MAKRTYWKLCNTNIVDVLSVPICSEREHLHKHQLPVTMHLSVTVVPCWYTSMCFHKDSRNIHVHSHHSLSSLTAVYCHISTACMHLILSTHTLPSGKYCKYMWTSFNVWLIIIRVVALTLHACIIMSKAGRQDTRGTCCPIDTDILVCLPHSICHGMNGICLRTVHLQVCMSDCILWQSCT